MMRNRLSVAVAAFWLTLAMLAYCPPGAARAQEAETAAESSQPAGMVASRPASQAGSAATQTTQPGGAAAQGPHSRPATAPTATLEQCRQLHMKGNYSPAADGYRRLMSDELLRAAAAAGLANALAAQGKYAEALDALDQVGPAAADDERVLLARTEALARVGRYEEGLAAAAKANELRPAGAEAILARGGLGNDDVQFFFPGNSVRSENAQPSRIRAGRQHIFIGQDGLEFHRSPCIGVHGRREQAPAQRRPAFLERVHDAGLKLAPKSP